MGQSSQRLVVAQSSGKHLTVPQGNFALLSLSARCPRSHFPTAGPERRWGRWKHFHQGSSGLAETLASRPLLAQGVGPLTNNLNVLADGWGP